MTTSSADLKLLHDQMLAQELPAAKEHDSADCPLCNMEEADNQNPEGGALMATYTEEDVQAAIALAVKPLEDEIAKFAASTEAAEVEARINEATAPYAEKITELETRLAEVDSAKAEEVAKLQANLDAATLEATTAKEELTATIAFLEATNKEAEEQTALAAKREERVAAVAEVASFPEEYVAEHADRWAAMSDEDFTASVESWKLIASKTEKTEKEEKIPAVTAMTAASEKTSSEGFSLVREMLNDTLQGIDPRTV